MFTNTYLPHVGGVARSVATLANGCRESGHEVRVIAPEFDGAEPSPYEFRVPAIQHFNGSDFCVRLPFPNIIREYIEEFQPDIIHSHHPFLLGDAAMREAWKTDVPIIFTHHTLYERYTHYVPLDSPALKRMAIQLATEYCNLCDQIVAPSESIAGLLKQRSVTTPVVTIPTGIDTAAFAAGNGTRFRERTGIDPHAKVIGHVGRLAEEKNLEFLAQGVVPCLRDDPRAVFLLVGDGDARKDMVTAFEHAGVGSRVHAVGKLSGTDLADAYGAMDWFAFASQTETQGIVLAEAMAAGTPVVALDGPGVREIVEDGRNGRLLPGNASPQAFASALKGLMAGEIQPRVLADHARATAAEYETGHCTRMMIESYAALIAAHDRSVDLDAMPWDRMVAGFGIEWDLLAAKVSAVAAGVSETPATGARLD